jgi:hypothetical protein
MIDFIFSYVDTLIQHHFEDSFDLNKCLKIGFDNINFSSKLLFKLSDKKSGSEL